MLGSTEGADFGLNAVLLCLERIERPRRQFPPGPIADYASVQGVGLLDAAGAGVDDVHDALPLGRTAPYRQDRVANFAAMLLEDGGPLPSFIFEGNEDGVGGRMLATYHHDYPRRGQALGDIDTS